MITAFALCAVIVVGCAVMMWLLGRAHDRVVKAVENAAAADHAFLASQIDLERVERRHASDKFAEILNKMSEDHANELRQTMNMKSLGVPVAGDAVMIPQKDDPETRVNKMVREHTVEAGAKQIMQRYEEAGLHITEKEAREQALALLEGRPISA